MSGLRTPCGPLQICRSSFPSSRRQICHDMLWHFCRFVWRSWQNGTLLQTEDYSTPEHCALLLFLLLRLSSSSTIPCEEIEAVQGESAAQTVCLADAEKDKGSRSPFILQFLSQKTHLFDTCFFHAFIFTHLKKTHFKMCSFKWLKIMDYSLFCSSAESDESNLLRYKQH